MTPLACRVAPVTAADLAAAGVSALFWSQIDTTRMSSSKKVSSMSGITRLFRHPLRQNRQDNGLFHNPQLYNPVLSNSPAWNTLMVTDRPPGSAACAGDAIGS